MHRQFFRLARPARTPRVRGSRRSTCSRTSARSSSSSRCRACRPSACEVTHRAGDAGRARRAAAAVRRLARARCGSSRFPMATSSGASRCREARLEAGTRELSARLPDPAAAQERRYAMNDMNEPTDSEPVSAERRRDRARRRARAAGAARSGEAASRPLPDDALIILPVRNVVLFPGMVLPLTVGRERSRAAAQEAVRLRAPARRAAAEQARRRRARARRPALGRHHRRRAALHHRARRRAPRDLPGRCSAFACCSSSTAIRSRSRACSSSTSPSAVDPEIEARARAEAARASRSCSCCRRCRRRWSPRCRASTARRGSPTSSPA